MKFTKLSLVAVLAVSSVFAGESTISGDAKVFYGTTDAGDTDLFNKNGAYGNAAVSLDYSRDIAEGVSLNAGMTGISTLGLESTLVSGVWAAAGQDAINDTAWIDVANITAKLGNTTAVIGRQKLDTPLAFTETWNIVENTFDAFTFVNADLPETTLVGSLVTRANGNVIANFNNLQGGMTDLGDGIYTAGAVTKLIPSTTAQLWYYDFANNDDKVWAQADADLGSGLTAGVQYAMTMANEGEDSSIIAGKVAYDTESMGLFAAYSKADEDGQTDFTNYGGFGMSNVYTEAWWNFGFATNPGAQAISVGASTDLAGLALTGQYTSVTNDSNLASDEMNEITVTATKTVGPVDTTLAFINTSSDDDSFDGNTVQAYLTVPFSL
ncbi:MAG: OprD family outer membrane porin [Epsilonproteobacteria bacterium]|nr:OprD family outer membrane porin [Campylobacterota bacterium]